MNVERIVAYSRLGCDLVATIAVNACLLFFLHAIRHMATHYIDRPPAYTIQLLRVQFNTVSIYNY